MKKLFTSILFLLIAANAFSQSDNNIAEDLIQSMRYQEALEYIDSQESTPHLQLQKAICYKALDNYGDAISILTALAEEDVNNIKLNIELASCYVAISDWQRGGGYYEKLTELDTTNVFFQTQYANILLKTGNYRKALPLYNSIYEKHRLKSVFKNKAECFENMNMNDSAAIYYQKAWDNNQHDTYSLASLINIYIKKGANMEAIALSNEYVKKDSTNRVINRLNALAYYTTNLFYDDAVKRFERCYQLGDSSLSVIKGLGMCHYTLGNAEKAYPHLIRTYQADTANVNTLFPLAIVCNDLKKSEEAITYYNKVLDKIIMPPTVLYLNYKGLATAYENNEQYDDALTNYIHSLKYASGQQRMTLLYDMGNMCAEKMKSYNNAFYYYEQYKNELVRYDRALGKEQEKEPTKERLTEIAEMKDKISSLDKRIAELQTLYNNQEEEIDMDSIYTDSAKKRFEETVHIQVRKDSIHADLKQDSIK